jgi:hypothetical protein
VPALAVSHGERLGGISFGQAALKNLADALLIAASKTMVGERDEHKTAKRTPIEASEPVSRERLRI